MNPTLLVGDIIEREDRATKPVAFPSEPISTTGFPQHKKRWKASTFKQRNSDSVGGSSPAGTKITSEPIQPLSFDEAERRRIDQENRQKLDSMLPEEIAQAQEDILKGMNPALIQRLLQRATIDEPDPNSPFNLPTPKDPQLVSAPPLQNEVVHAVEDQHTDPSPELRPESQAPVHSKKSPKKIAEGYDEDREPSQIPTDLFPITDLPKSNHFPAPPTLPDLDPSDPNFLTTLHEKYFPSLPSDPSKLAWMAPIPTEDSIADKDSSYYPHPEISVSALRFDFRGRFLSPRVSRAIPSSKGLHHHGDAPEAAGYTIAELARLARSAVPAQRCIAFQTLGRILYRLGLGEWGKGPDDPIAMGVWNSVRDGRVLESLAEASLGEGGHRGSRAYALEALWLFEKGGWREKLQVR